MKNDLYFSSVDDVTCYGLKEHLNEASIEGLKTIKLVKAIPDKPSDYTWCTYNGEVIDRCDCSKKWCSYYKANKSGRGACIHRGKLYTFGEEIEFDVEKTLNELK